MLHRTDHLALGEGFYDLVRPATFPESIVRFQNRRWAERIGLGGADESEWVRRFARFEPFEGGFPEPAALRYHGHQFHQYNPDLGDGRGFLYSQVEDPVDGRLLDFGTKGSGQTPWSRRGDGRLTLKGGVREILATEMLESIGVYTSKTLSIIETGEDLQRTDEPSPTRSCVLTRLSHSHLRFGTAQRLAFLGEHESLQQLVSYASRTYFPDLDGSVVGLLGEVARQNARLAASWMVAGFVHGVLNTDNLNFTGESFDYGPWRFLQTYDPAFTAAYFDHQSLYAFGRQPSQVFWALQRLAEAFSPLAERSELIGVLEVWPAQFEAELHRALNARLGLRSSPAELPDATFQMLWATQAPFEQVFQDWFGADGSRAAHSPNPAVYTGPEFDRWRELLGRSEPVAGLDVEPGPCESMEIDEVEALWSAIDTEDDWEPLRLKVERIRAGARPVRMHPEDHIAIEGGAE